MSFRLPPSTEINKVIPKKAIIEKFSLSGKDRALFDSSIHRIVISNEISPRTVNVAPGRIGGIFILKVELRNEDYDGRIVQMLFRLIDQKMVMILECGVRCRPTIFNDVLIEGEWMLESDLSLDMNGLDTDDVWENLVIQIGKIDISSGNSLSEQIEENERRKVMEAKIEQLEKKMRTEKQPRKKRELFEMIQRMKESNRRCISVDV